MERRNFIKSALALLALPATLCGISFPKPKILMPLLASRTDIQTFSVDFEIKFKTLPNYWYNEDTRIEIVEKMDNSDPEKARQIKLMKEQYTTDKGKDIVAKLESSLQKS